MDKEQKNVLKMEIEEQWYVVQKHAMFRDYAETQKALNEIRKMFSKYRKTNYKNESSPPPVPLGGSVGTSGGSLTKDEEKKRIEEMIANYRKKYES